MKKMWMKVLVLLVLGLFACSCAGTPKGESSDKKDKTDKQDKQDKADKVDKKDKTDKQDKADKADKVDKKDKIDKQDKADKTDKADKEIKDSADESYRKGMKEFKKGDFNEAIAEFKKATEKDSGHLLAYYALGQSYESLKRITKAEEAYEEAIKIDPKHLPTREALGLVYFHLENYKKAESHLKAARTLDSKVPEVYFALGEIEQKEKSCRTAIIAYKQALKLNPNYLEARNALKIAEADCRKKGVKKTGPQQKPTQPRPQTQKPVPAR